MQIQLFAMDTAEGYLSIIERLRVCLCGVRGGRYVKKCADDFVSIVGNEDHRFTHIDVVECMNVLWHSHPDIQRDLDSMKSKESYPVTKDVLEITRKTIEKWMSILQMEADDNGKYPLICAELLLLVLIYMAMAKGELLLPTSPTEDVYRVAKLVRMFNWSAT